MTCLAVCAAMRPKSMGGSGIDQHVPDLGIRLLATGARDGDLRGLVLDRLDDLKVAFQLDLAGFAVDQGADVVFVPVFRAARLLDRLFHGHEDLFAFNALVARDRVRDLNQFRPGHAGDAFHLHHSRPDHPVADPRGPRRLRRLSRRSRPVPCCPDRCPDRDRRAALAGGFVRSHGGAQQVFRHDQLGLGQKAQGNAPVLLPVRAGFGGAHEDGALVGPADQYALDPTAAVHRRVGLDADLVPGVAVEVLGPGQGPIDAGRTDLQVIGALDRVVDVQHGRQAPADGLAVLHRHVGSVPPFRHDLKDLAVLAHDQQAHERIAHVMKRWFNQGHQGGVISHQAACRHGGGGHDRPGPPVGAKIGNKKRGAAAHPFIERSSLAQPDHLSRIDDG